MAKLVAIPEDSVLTDPNVLRFLAFIAGLSAASLGRVAGFFQAIGAIDASALQAFGSFLNDPVAFVQAIALAPLLDFLFAIGTTTIDLILFLFLGGNRVPGAADGSSLGLFDVPLVVINAMIVAGQQLAMASFQAIVLFNEAVAVAVEPLGPLAFVVIVFLVGVEIVIAGAVAFVIYRVGLEVALFVVELFTQVPVDSLVDAIVGVYGGIIRFLRELIS